MKSESKTLFFPTAPGCGWKGLGLLHHSLSLLLSITMVILYFVLLRISTEEHPPLQSHFCFCQRSQLFIDSSLSWSASYSKFYYWGDTSKIHCDFVSMSGLPVSCMSVFFFLFFSKLGLKCTLKQNVKSDNVIPTVSLSNTAKVQSENM